MTGNQESGATPREPAVGATSRLVVRQGVPLHSSEILPISINQGGPEAHAGGKIISG